MLAKITMAGLSTFYDNDRRWLWWLFNVFSRVFV